MNSPPLVPKPKPAALPSHLLKGSSPLHKPSRAKERENLTSSIKSTYGRRTSISLENGLDGISNPASQPWRGQQENPTAGTTGPEVSLNEAPRDLRDVPHPLSPPVTASRPASPYTLNPPIDFDGLSWPSVSLTPTCVFSTPALLTWFSTQVSGPANASRRPQSRPKND